MDINVSTIIGTLINFALLIGIIIAIYKATRGVTNFIKRNRELDKKVDIILSKLDKKDNE